MYGKILIEYFKFAKKHYNVMCTGWEMSHVPSRYLKNTNLFHEIMGYSTFAKNVLKSSGVKTKCTVADFDMKIHDNFGIKYDRTYFGLPKDKLLFLVSGSYTSGHERKNFIGAIQGFKEAFEGKNDVALVVHIHCSKTHGDKLYTEFEQYCEKIKEMGGKNIIIINSDDDFSYEKTIGLKRSCDCLISPHKCEGYGLNIAEMAEVGKNVIMTGWSGNMDIIQNSRWSNKIQTIKYNLVKVKPENFIWVDKKDDNCYWAECDLNDMVGLMQGLYQNFKKHL